MADRDRFERLERAVRSLDERTKGLPVRRGEGASSDAEPLPLQLAVVTEAAAKPTYSGADLTFAIEFAGSPDSFGRAILLNCDDNVDLDGQLKVRVNNVTGATIEELEIAFINIHRDVPVKVGDLIRVWKNNGEAITPGEVDLHTESDPWIFAELFNATDYLRGLHGYDPESETPLILSSTEDEIEWIEADGFEGPPGPTGPTGPQGPPGAGTALDPGYCIEFEDDDPDIVHLNQITNDAGTAATGLNAAAFQIWVHADDATTREDAKWETITGYDDTKTQLVGHISGTWHAKTIAEWLELLEGFVEANNQSIGHDEDEPPEWQDDGDCDSGE